MKFKQQVWKRTIQGVAITLATVLALNSTALSVDSKNTAYCGGTVPGFDGAKDVVEGTLDTKNPTQLVFTALDKPFRGKTFAIPYSRVIDLEYGQKAGRRVGTAVATTVWFGPIGLLFVLEEAQALPDDWIQGRLWHGSGRRL